VANPAIFDTTSSTSRSSSRTGFATAPSAIPRQPDPHPAAALSRPATAAHDMKIKGYLRIQIRRRVHGRSTTAGVRRPAVARRRGDPFPRSGLWRAGWVNCPSMPPSRRTGTTTARPSRARVPGTPDTPWRVARRAWRRQRARSGAGHRGLPCGGSLLASCSSLPCPMPSGARLANSRSAVRETANTWSVHHRR
jgi:hypothetical protein